uniref:Uncharacterized protein n=1 Tax=Pithovirus LCPAC403 TaxID=2506596 RepID=A0A481ZD13_9VIRU|nr:MAG: hypothetical protein LCPAC403_03560 [Pithovirus LCPAC403]
MDIKQPHCKKIKLDGTRCYECPQEDGFCYAHGVFNKSKEMCKCEAVLTLSEKNEIAKNIFRDCAKRCIEGKVKDYQPRYFEDDHYFNLDLSKVLIRATSRGSAVFILMRHLDLVTPLYIRNTPFMYFEKLVELYDCYEIYADDEDLKTCYVDNFIRELEENGLDRELFNDFIDGQFTNDTLWLEEVKKVEKLILTAETYE